MSTKADRMLTFVAIFSVVMGLVGIARADFIFGEAACVDKVINNGTNVQECSFLHDGLKLYFSYNLPGGYGNRDLWVSTRQAQDAPWQEPVNLGPNVNGPNAETYPTISPDELEIYFQYGNGPGLMRSVRASKDEPWGPASRYTDLGDVYDLDFSPDGLTVYFDAMGVYGGWDICMATRETLDAPWSEHINLGPSINDSGNQFGPSISNDGLVLFFYKDLRIYMAQRSMKDHTWGPPVYLGPSVNGYGWAHGPEISPDGSVLYFDSNANRPGGYGGENFWQVPIIPIVDLNSDGIVDAADMCIMVDHWGEDYSLCDIGPMPWGDGVVDVQDLIVLAEHLFEEVDDPTLIAHWPFDEAQGVVAYNDASDRDGTLTNGPVWQPDGGTVAGAIQFDGIDDYVETDPALNPADGVFSVLAWIQGGAPSQVVLSQVNGLNWLMLDAEGKLMTELKAAGRGAAGPLLSEASITDGNWHRIGFVWDGSYRHLYVDGIEVAADVEPLASDLEGSYGDLYFGAGSDLVPGTFFCGLIDDVRIYSRVVSP